MSRHSPQSLEPNQRSLKLESLPLEILEEIMVLACTDGGYTDCSLALVSKFIRAVSRSARFHSVVLLSDSFCRLDSFLACFAIAKHEAEKDGGVRPRIRHLCLATTPSPSLSFTESCPRWGLLDIPNWLDLQHVGQLWNHKQWLMNLTDYHAAVQFILQLASEDVETLCLLGSREWSVGHAVPKPAVFVSGVFPRLRELSLAGVQPTLFTTSHSPTSLFPVMSRLHIGAELMEDGNFQRWIDDAPRLRTLRVTCDNYILTPSWIDGFQEAMNTLGSRHADLRVMLLVKPFVGLRDSIALRFHTVFSALVENPHQASTHCIFVPYYYRQDVHSRTASQSDTFEGLLWKDWLARLSNADGVVLDDFWDDYQGEGFVSRLLMKWRHGALYVPPFIRL